VKKLSLMLVMMFLLVLTPGCGKEKKDSKKEDTKQMGKVLSCKDESIDGIITSYNLNFNESDSLENGTSDITMTYGKDITDADIESAIKEMQTAADNSGMKLTYQKGDKDITFTLEFNAAKLAEVLGTEYEDKSIKLEEIKKDLEEKEYTCTIK